MDIKPIIKGTAAGITAGTVCYMISRSPKSKKRTLKKRITKIFDAVSDTAYCLRSMIM